MPRIRFFLIILFLSIFSINSIESFASDADSLENRKLSHFELQKLRGSKDYKSIVNYQKEVSTNEGWLKRWFNKMLSLMFGNKISLNFFRVLPYLILVIAFVLAVLRLSNIKVSSIFRKDSKKINQASIVENPENIEDIPLEKLLDKARKKSDFRLMIRYSYLLILKTLNEQNFIEWQKHKSNYEYVYETRSSSFSKTFASLTKYYEFIWYGDFQINPENGQYIFDELQKFIDQLIVED